MGTTPNPPSVAANRIRETRLYGIKTAMLLAFLAAGLLWFFFYTSAAARHDRANGLHPEPVWPSLLFVGFFLLPQIASLVLLSTRRQRNIVLGAGIAGGFFSAVLLLSPGIVLMMFLFIGLSAGSSRSHGADPGLLTAGACLLAYLAIAVCIGIASLRIGKNQWGAFFLALAVTWLYLAIGFPRLKLAAYRAQQKAERQKEQKDMDLYKPQMLARQRIVSLTACLLTNRMVHPDSEFPATLENLPRDSGCERAPAANAIPQYTFAYLPHIDAKTHRVVDFQLTAIPKAKGVMNRNPMLVDSRGIVFVYYPWEMAGVTPKIMIMPSDRSYSQIDQLRSNIQAYSANEGSGVAPATITPEVLGALGHEMPTIADGGTRLETRDFVARYSPGKVGDAKGFVISLQCQSFGQNCLRSYFSDQPGVIHATGEPRQANADDPVSPQCEVVYSECKDVDWTVP
jgi:hypothetical protein